MINIDPLTSKLNFRKMESFDLPAVIALDQLSFTLPWPESAFHFEVEKNPAARCWVIETCGNPPVIVGMIVVWLIIDEVHIATFAVDPEKRSQHIGQKLLAFTLLNGVENGAEKSFLEVRSGNVAARTLYRKFGFEEVGIRKKYYSDNGEDAILMNLDPIDPGLLKTLL
jgi:[ribosomal protein S18]-alanine N-acetyltransferase